MKILNQVQNDSFSYRAQLGLHKRVGLYLRQLSPTIVTHWLTMATCTDNHNGNR